MDDCKAVLNDLKKYELLNEVEEVAVALPVVLVEQRPLQGRVAAEYASGQALNFVLTQVQRLLFEILNTCLFVVSCINKIFSTRLQLNLKVTKS